MLMSDHEIVCETAPGLGKALVWEVQIRGQTSSVNVNNTDTTAITSSYAAPAIVSLSPNTGPTSGDTKITLDGTNFGGFVAGSFVEILMDGEPIPLDGRTKTKITRSDPSAHAFSQVVDTSGEE